jgi:dipeptidyl aminopeptidase/acylaminoacyl peptidase
VEKIAVAALVVLASLSVRAQAVFVQSGNVIYRDASGPTEVLTETGADSNPVISPDGSLVAFSRLHPGEPEQSEDAGSGPLRDLWVLRIADRKATRLVVAKHAQKPEEELSGIRAMKFSPDGSTLYFSTAAWVTSGAIHAVPVKGGRQRFVVNGNGIAVVKRGKYVGYIVTSQHRYMDGHGSWNPYVLVSPAGKQIKVLGEFGDDDARAEAAALRSVEAER